MPPSPRRPLPVLAAVLGLALAGCGGAGYGEPIAATDGDPSTVALVPSPVTTAAAAPAATTTTAPAGGTAGGSGSGSGAGGDGGDTGGGAGGSGTSGSGPGASASSGDAALTAYARDANRFCTGFVAATRNLTSRIAAAGASNPTALGRAIVDYGTAVDAAARGLRAAPPPSSLASYHRRTLAWVSGVTAAISANRSGLRNGNPAAGGTVIAAVQRLGAPPTAPASVRSRASACDT